MTPIAYTGFRPTMHYIGLVWLGKAILGIETSPDAFGIVIFGVWIGVVKDD